MAGKVFPSFAMRINQLKTSQLAIDHFSIKTGEAWCLFGSISSGIDQFIKIISDNSFNLPSKAFAPPLNLAIVSFSRQQEIYEEELANDNTDFLDTIDPGTPAKNFLDGPKDISFLLDTLGIKRVLNSGYRQLSTGESRKLLILQALSRNSDLLLLENPYEGLDQRSCTELDRAISILTTHLPPVIVTAHNRCDIPPWCSHIAHFESGTLIRQGRREAVLPSLSNIAPEQGPALASALDQHDTQEEKCQELVSIKNGFAAYGERVLFSGLDLTVNSTQHTLITGPNGSGKSTLLQIITGDNQNCYTNTLSIFGKKRGTGESIWDIKRQMGILSSDLHRNYRAPGKAYHVVISGLFDSIGVYKHFNEQQKKDAFWWLALTGLEKKAEIPFRNLSYAEQRLVLIARALIKMPRLLILDEPTQGLDENSRLALLHFLEKVVEKRLSTIIYASHRQDEFLPFFQQHLTL